MQFLSRLFHVGSAPLAQAELAPFPSAVLWFSSAAQHPWLPHMARAAVEVPSTKGRGERGFQSRRRCTSWRLNNLVQCLPSVNMLSAATLILISALHCLLSCSFFSFFLFCFPPQPIREWSCQGNDFSIITHSIFAQELIIASGWNSQGNLIALCWISIPCKLHGWTTRIPAIEILSKKGFPLPACLLETRIYQDQRTLSNFMTWIIWLPCTFVKY